jgi:phosphatidylglycerophosphatase A
MTMTTTQAHSKTAWAWVTGTFFGIGLLPGGPGTWASLATAGIWYFAARAAHLSRLHLLEATFIVYGVVLVAGISASSIVEEESGIQDPGFVVIDEVAGQLMALMLLPAELRYVALAFVLFRLFDILKPPPVRQLERLHGGAGIMMDDVAAGVYALIIVVTVHHWW